MAKRGIMYYVTMSVGVGMVSYLLYTNWKSSQNLKEFSSSVEMYEKAEGKPLVTQQKIRSMGERNKSDKVPLSDSSSGYM